MYTREELKSQFGKARKDHLLNKCNLFIQQVLHAAKSGESKILLNLEHLKPKNNLHVGRIFQSWESPPTLQEIKEVLQESFPDSCIEYKEEWVQTGPDKQILQKGILVDWS